MRKGLKCFGIILFTLVLFVIVASLAFYHLIRTGELQRYLVSEIESKTEFKVQLGEAELEMGRILGVAFSDFALSEPDAMSPAITAERITARVALLPLFERKLILYGVRLYKPTARLVRDKEGRLPLLEKLRNLPFWTQEATQFGLDLRAIRIRDGEIDFEDQLSQKAPRTTRFRNVDLEIGRIRVQRSADLVKEVASPSRSEPPGAALDFNLRSDVGIDNEKAALRARGRMVFPQQTSEFRSAWWNADLQFDNLSAELLRQYMGGEWPMKNVTGVFAPRLHVQGSPAGQIRLRGALTFKQLAIDAPDLFTAPFSPGDGQAEFDLDWKPERLGIALFDFRSKELRLTVKGETRLTFTNDPHVQLNVTAPMLSLAALRKYFPIKMMDSSPLESLVGSLQEGELQLKRLGINGSLSELRNVAQSAAKGLIWFDGELRNVGLRPIADGYFPFQGIQGLIRLEKGVFTFTDVTGTYGQSRFTDVNGTYTLAPEGRADLEVRAVGELDLAELHKQIRLGVLPTQVTKLSSSLGDLGGKGQIQVNLRRSAESPPYFEGTLTLDNARLRFDDISLTEIKGDLTLSPTEIRGEKMRALLSNSPVQIQLSLTNYASDGGNFDLRVDSTGVRAGTVTRLLLSAGSTEDPGMVSGSVRYQGSLRNKGDRKFTGNLELFGVKLEHKPLLEPLREVSGRVNFDDTGIDFLSLKGLLVGMPFEFGGRWRYTQKPQLIFTLTAPTLDLAYLLSQMDPESTEWYETLTAQGKVSLRQGSMKGFEFSDLKSDLNLDRRVWRLENSAMRSADGSVQGTVTIADKPDSVKFALAPKIQSVPVQEVLNWFETGQSEVTGKVNMTGYLESAGKDGAERKRNLNGSLSVRIEDGTIHRLRLVVQLLNVLDLSRWFTLKLPDLSKEGIRFRSISGDFAVQRGVFSTQNLIVDSDDLRMTGGGKIDVANDEIEFVLAVRPFAGIDTVINYIPLLGRGVAAVKNSFLVASFNIKGPIEDPTITPAPLSTISEWVFGVLGIPKNIIGWGGDERKELPQNSPPPEQTNENAPPTTK